jgi:hypothetical protein
MKMAHAGLACEWKVTQKQRKILVAPENQSRFLGSAFVPAHMTIALRKPRTLQQLSKYS